MIIEKNGKKYEAYEKATVWTVTLKSGALTVDFQVSKEICKTEAELREYIKNEKMF